mmetsp:Transcript_16259/g.40054  ORF Transcript_16259/g.40054 Transcript_16259/m.40054 type:complete len:285 (+) Transcript_16259:272-1126(+)
MGTIHSGSMRAIDACVSTRSHQRAGVVQNSAVATNIAWPTTKAASRACSAQRSMRIQRCAASMAPRRGMCPADTASYIRAAPCRCAAASARRSSSVRSARVRGHARTREANSPPNATTRTQYAVSATIDASAPSVVLAGGQPTSANVLSSNCAACAGATRVALTSFSGVNRYRRARMCNASKRSTRCSALSAPGLSSTRSRSTLHKRVASPKSSLRSAAVSAASRCGTARSGSCAAMWWCAITDADRPSVAAASVSTRCADSRSCDGNSLYSACCSSTCTNSYC